MLISNPEVGLQRRGLHGFGGTRFAMTGLAVTCLHSFPQLLTHLDHKQSAINKQTSTGNSSFQQHSHKLTIKFTSNLRKYTIIHRFLVGPFPLRKKAQLLQWVVFFSLQSHPEWYTFHTIFMSHEFLLAKYFYFFKSLRSIFTSSKKLNGAKGYPLRVFSAL